MAGSRVVSGASFAEFASLCPGWRVGAGGRVEALAFVVVGVPGDEPGVVPYLDGFGGHPEAGGHLGQGEHAGVAESLFAAAQPVFVADVADDEPVEGAAFAAGQAAVVDSGSRMGAADRCEMRSEAVTVPSWKSLTCGNVLRQQLCGTVCSVRIEGVMSSNPLSSTERSARLSGAYFHVCL